MDEAINSDKKSIGVIVLAAGASVRMNQPKQLLQFQGKTLLRRAVESAIESICNPVVVVLGAHFEKTKAEIADLPAKIVFNEDWQSGLSWSIKAGIKILRQIAPDAAAVVLTLADQPFVTARHLNLFVEKFYQTNNSIIAAGYNETTGVPALFSHEIFGEFDKLAGERGAKAIIEMRRHSLLTVPLPEAAFDIDTPQDLASLNL